MSVDALTAQLDPRVALDASGMDSGLTDTPWRSAKEGRHTAPVGVIASDGKNPLVVKDADGDVSVKLIDMNPNRVTEHAGEKAVAPSYDAATQGRDYWLSPGVPHCADCHAAPFVEAQGGTAYPINQPGKYSSMRYSKGHVGLSCQACHESIHGLYPVTPDVDRTTYEQAARLNPDGSHGPFKCGACHKDVNGKGVPMIAAKIRYKGRDITHDYDVAVEWMHASAPRHRGDRAESPGRGRVILGILPWSLLIFTLVRLDSMWQSDAHATHPVGGNRWKMLPPNQTLHFSAGEHVTIREALLMDPPWWPIARATSSPQTKRSRLRPSRP